MNGAASKIKEIAKMVLAGLALAGLAMIAIEFAGPPGGVIVFTGYFAIYFAYVIGHKRGWQKGHSQGWLRCMDDMNTRRKR